MWSTCSVCENSQYFFEAYFCFLLLALNSQHSIESSVKISSRITFCHIDNGQSTRRVTDEERLFACWLLNVAATCYTRRSNMLVYVRDGSAQTERERERERERGRGREGRRGERERERERENNCLCVAMQSQQLSRLTHKCVTRLFYYHPCYKGNRSVYFSAPLLWSCTEYL